MRETISRRLTALETRHRPKHQPRTFVVMPWDVEPAACPDDIVMTVAFVRPTDQPGGERVPYARTGIHPADDEPGSHNGRRHQATADAKPRTFQQFETGGSIYMPHNGREPHDGGSYA
jgi:hypothetical protein